MKPKQEDYDVYNETFEDHADSKCNAGDSCSELDKLSKELESYGDSKTTRQIFGN